MQQLHKYSKHIESRDTVAKAAWKMEHTALSFKTEIEPLRNEFLHLHALAEEVVAAVKIMLETDEIIVSSQTKADELGAVGDAFGKLKEQGSLEAAEAWTRMSLSWKIFLYSVRCFQDCVYRAILHAQLEHGGLHASMSKCVSGGTWRYDAPIAKLISSHLPAYPDWFIRTRELRNELKKGLSVQSVWKGREPEHYISLCKQRWSGHMIDSKEVCALRLEFATESVEMCLAVVSLIPIALDEVRLRKQARDHRMKGDAIKDAPR